MENRKVQEPYPMFGPGSELFPASPEMPDGVRSVTWPTPETGYMMNILPDIVYQSLGGTDQHLQICTPLDTLFIPVDLTEKRPLVVYVPGSAWHQQDVWKGVDKARYFVARGYIFAIVEYRPSDIAPFPAQIRDAEAAVRFLLDHAKEYRIDTDRVALWGDSSGGHTVVSLAVERPELARCVADWYGPMDIEQMSYYPSAQDHHAPDSPEGYLIGQIDVLENRELAQKTNPLNRITPELPLPPILICHGPMDNVVPFNQSVRLYEKLRECGKQTLFYRVEGAGHGTGGFTSREALEATYAWIDSHLR